MKPLLSILFALSVLGCDDRDDDVQVTPMTPALAANQVELEGATPPRAAPRPDDPGMSPANTQGTITDDMLLTYVELAPLVVEVQESVRMDLRAARTEAEAAAILEEATEDLREVFRGSGLTADEFAAIDIRVKRDLELQDRLDDLLEDLQDSG